MDAFRKKQSVQDRLYKKFSIKLFIVSEERNQEMKKKGKIILTVMFIILLFLLAIVGNFYLNKKDNIRRYFDIRVPTSCEFISYEDTGELGHIKAVVKVNELEMKEVLGNVKRHYGKAEDDISKEECYSTFEWADFGIEKERVMKMYESIVTRRDIFSYKKSAFRYIYFVKEGEEEYYICFYTAK